jgi:RNA polymerase sigma-70 factor, ECF subfamily
MQQTVSMGASFAPTLEDLYSRYRLAILNFFIGYGWTHEDAEDLTQDTFLKAWKAFSKISHENVLSWLYCIARNVAIDARRRQVVREHVSSDGYEDQHPDGHNQEDHILTRLSLVEAMRLVPQHYRRAVLLSAYGYSLPEIAALVNDSPKAMKGWVHRGRKAVKRQYREVCL